MKIGHCPKCGLLGQVDDICQNCGERFIHHNSTELREANQKISKIYNVQSDNNVVITSKSSTQIIIIVVIALSFVSVLILLLQRDRTPKPYIVSSEHQTSAPIQKSNVKEPPVIKETPVVKDTPVVPRPRIEEARVYQASNPDNNKTNWQATSPSDEPRPLTKEDIQQTMRMHGAQIRTCARTSSVKGSIKISFIVTKKGDVKDYKNVSPEFSGQPVVTCIAQIIRNLKFHKLDKDTPVFNYPIQIQ